MTSGGRLLLYSPPHSMWKVWKLTLDISSILTKIKSTDFPVIPTTLADQESPVADKRDSVTGQASSHFKHLFSVCTAFSWLPCTVENDGKEQSAVVAMATRSGHVVIVEIPTPITETRSVHLLTIHHVYIILTSCIHNPAILFEHLMFK